MAVTPVVRPVTCTGPVTLLVEPLPSSPEKLLPQHCTPPPDVRAHAKSFPADTAIAPLVRPGTGIGVDEHDETPQVAPLEDPGTETGLEKHDETPQCAPLEATPGSPSSSPPQHPTPPGAVTAQA